MNYVIIAWWTTHKDNDADIWFDYDKHSAIQWCKKNCRRYYGAMVCDKYGNIVYKQEIL